MRKLIVQWVGVVGVLLCAAGAAGQSCNYGEPASSNCIAPRVISGWEGQHVVLMDCHAATNAGTIGGVPVGHQVYFDVTPQVSGPMTVSTCHPNTTYDTVVGLYNRAELCQFDYLTHNDDAYLPECPANCTGWASNLTWNVTAGTTYTIIVGSYNSNPQNCYLCLGLIVSIGTPCGDPPRNFICDLARPLSGAPGVQTVYLDTTDAGGWESWSCQGSVGGLVWFVITPEISGDLFVNTCRPWTNYDSVLRVQTGTCGGGMAQLTCVDDVAGCGFLPTAAYAWVPVNAGQTYYIEVGAYNGASGCLELLVDLVLPLVGACCYDSQLCVVTDLATCEQQLAGDFMGAGTDCADTNGNGVADVCEGPDPCLTDVQAPGAALLAPSDFDCVALGGVAPILGTAQDPEGNLLMWRLEERAMDSASWQVLANGSSAVMGGLLTYWSPAVPGYRMLRLTVEDACGHAATAVRLVYVDAGPQALINSPQEGAVVGGTVCIDGLVNHGVCALSWTLSWRPVGGSWLTLAGGNGSVYNLQLASWDTTGLTGEHELLLVVESIGGVAQAQVQVMVDNAAPDVLLSALTNCAGIDGLVPVYGVVADDNLSSWALQWSGGPSHAWNTIASGVTPTSGLLGSWDVSELPVCGYALRLIASDLASVNCTGNSHQTEYVVTVRVGEPGGDADLDGDGDVDVRDFALFMTFFTGPL